MGILFWADRMSVGIEAIDNQHKNIIQQINDIYEALQNGQSAELKNSLHSLYQATVAHFSYEEGLLNKYQYPESKEHADQHKVLLEQASVFIGKFTDKNQTVELTDDIIEFMKTWLINHVMKDDKKYSAFLQKYEH